MKRIIFMVFIFILIFYLCGCVIETKCDCNCNCEEKIETKVEEPIATMQPISDQALIITTPTPAPVQPQNDTQQINTKPNDWVGFDRDPYLGA